MYGDGRTEELLSRAMKGRVEELILTTNIGWQGFDAKPNRSAYGSVDKVVSGVETNVRRLQTDYVKAFNADGGCSTLQIDYGILNRRDNEASQFWDLHRVHMRHRREYSEQVDTLVGELDRRLWASDDQAVLAVRSDDCVTVVVAPDDGTAEQVIEALGLD